MLLLQNFFKFTSILILCSFSFSFAQPGKSGYVKGDFHQHTNYTDGSYSIETQFYICNKYGLDWWANSEHGGSSATEGSGETVTKPPFQKMTVKYFDSYEPNPIIGRVNMTKEKHQRMWRWQSLRDYSFKVVDKLRKTYPDKVILQSLEWNVPGHEHCSMGLIANQFDSKPNCNPLAEFEYKFDEGDTDTSGGILQGWVKSTKTGHEKAIDAALWLKKNYPAQSYMVFGHPERKKLYTVAAFRDLNNAAPEIAIGIEACPGHHKSATRGEYSAKADGEGTYGGWGIYTAKIGGLWDALLGEGRRFWIFSNSDAHNVGDNADMTNGDDFFPGEYQKNYTYVKDRTSPQSIVDGLRSGNTFVVTGDLIDSLNFTINGAAMGQYAKTENNSAVVNIIIRDPESNSNNVYSNYKNPSVNHIDLIAGNYSSKAIPGTAEYNSPVNSSTKVVARFDAVGGIKDANGIVSIKWADLGNGIKKMSVTIPEIKNNTYFRLRGTNHSLNTRNETDENGNTLPDTLIANNAITAFADLWFYSNPVFIGTRPVNSENK